MIVNQRYQRRAEAQEHYNMQDMSSLTDWSTKLLLDTIAFTIFVAANVVITSKNKQLVEPRVFNPQSRNFTIWHQH